MEVPTPPRVLTGRARSALLVLGIAAGGLAAGAAFTLLIVELIRFVSAYWRWIIGAVVVLILFAAFGAVVLGLRAHEARLRERRLREIAHLDRVDAMTGSEFEALVADLLRRDGYRHVDVVGRGGDQGVDVIGRTPDGRRIAVQCKRQNRTVSADRVRNLIGAVHSTYLGHVGVLVTSSTFTAPAVSEGSKMLVLIDRECLAGWMDGDVPVI